MVRNAFKRNLRKLDWMDEETRAAAIKKADAISKMIGEHASVTQSAII